jgi:diaminopimelate epimerase
MRLINPDGTDGEISGNGVRCLASYVVWKGWLPARHTVLTPPGPRAVEVAALEERRFEVLTDLGEPGLDSRAIPVALDPPRERVVDHPLDLSEGRVRITATSMGNPHCALFLDEPADDALLRSLGPALETHAFFPHRTNVELVTVLSRNELRVRFWERGVGVTRASGTGSASAVVAAVITGRADRKARVACDGGSLDVHWPEGGTVRQTGEVELVAEGEWLGTCARFSRA